MNRLIWLAMLAGLSGAGEAAARPAPARPAAMTVDLVGAKGRIGYVQLEEGPRGVMIRLQADTLRPGWHAVHIHDVAECREPGFASAGGHVHRGRGEAVHGLLNPRGDDAGDLPNIYAGPNGVARGQLFSTFVTLSGAPGRVNLLDRDGSALVIHQNEDDYKTQPIGGAGPRLACAAIR